MWKRTSGQRLTSKGFGRTSCAHALGVMVRFRNRDFAKVSTIPMNLYTHFYYKLYRYYRKQKGIYSGWPQGHACVVISVFCWAILIGALSFLRPQLVTSTTIYGSAITITALNFCYFYRGSRYEEIATRYDELHPVDQVRGDFVTIAVLACAVSFYIWSIYHNF